MRPFCWEKQQYSTLSLYVNLYETTKQSNIYAENIYTNTTSTRHNFYMENLPNVRRKNHGTIVHSNTSAINNNRNTRVFSSLNQRHTISYYLQEIQFLGTNQLLQEFKKGLIKNKGYCSRSEKQMQSVQNLISLVHNEELHVMNIPAKFQFNQTTMLVNQSG